MRRRGDWLVIGLVIVIAAGLIGVASAANGQADRPPLKAWGFQPGTSASPVIPTSRRPRCSSFGSRPPP